MKHLNNKGVTLVELLVVIAIMAIMVGASMGGLGILSNGRVKEAVSYMDSYISDVKVKTMSISALEWNVSIEDTGDGYEISIKRTMDGVDYEVIKSEKISSSVELTYGGIIVNYMKIVFNQSTGSVKSLIINGSSVDIATSSESDIFTFTSGNSEKTLKIYYNTGKTELE